MYYTVTYAIDSLDTCPTVKTFDCFYEAQNWIADEVQRRVEWAVAHSPYALSESDIEALEETEYSLVRIS